jgi:hypothetical protein
LGTLVPVLPGPGLVFANQQKQICAGPIGSNLPQRVYGVARAWALNFSGVDGNPSQISKAQPRHGQAVVGRAQGALFVPGLASGHNQQAVELKVLQSAERQGTMGGVWRVKRAAKHANFWVVNQGLN